MKSSIRDHGVHCCRKPPCRPVPLRRFSGEGRGNWPTPECVLAADKSDPEDFNLYHSAAVKYPWAEDCYFVFFGAFCYYQHNVDAQIATSRDGIHWSRPSREPFLRLGAEGSFDCRSIYMGMGMIALGDQILMYYAGLPVGHNQPQEPPGACIGCVRVAKHRFVGQRAAWEGGDSKLYAFGFQP